MKTYDNICKIYSIFNKKEDILSFLTTTPYDNFINLLSTPTQPVPGLDDVMLHVSEGGDVGGPDGGQVFDCLLTQATTRGPGLLGRPGAQLGAGPLLYRHL